MQPNHATSKKQFIWYIQLKHLSSGDASRVMKQLDQITLMIDRYSSKYDYQAKYELLKRSHP